MARLVKVVSTTAADAGHSSESTAIARICSRVASMLWARRPCSWVDSTTVSSGPLVSQPQAHRTRSPSRLSSGIRPPSYPRARNGSGV